MYIINKLGIYVYPTRVALINGIRFSENSISYTDFAKWRVINNKIYGIKLSVPHNVDKRQIISGNGNNA